MSNLRDDQYVTARAGARLTGVDVRHIRRLAREGHIAVRRLPESARARVRYSLRDLERLARQAAEPARTKTVDIPGELPTSDQAALRLIGVWMLMIRLGQAEVADEYIYQIRKRGYDIKAIEPLLSDRSDPRLA